MKAFIFILFFLTISKSYCRELPNHKFYFSSRPNGKEDGSKQHPYTSLGVINQLPLQPGDSIFFKAGDTLTGNVLLNRLRGKMGKPIVFTSYNGGKCIIDGGNNEAIVISNSGYFEILNMVMNGNGRKNGNTTNGLKIIGCKNFKVKNTEVSGFQKSGLLLFNCETAEVDHVVAHDNGATGILVDGDNKKRGSNNIHIINCKAENNPGDPSKLDNHSGNGILAGNCKNVLIEYCTATNNGWDMPYSGNGPVGIWVYEADSVIIQHCISYRNKTKKGAADGGGFDLDGGVTNSIIQYCLSYENQGSGYGIYQYWSAGYWSNNTVRFCISINDGFETQDAAGMIIWNGWNGDSTFTNFYAYNNFFYNDHKYAISFSPYCQHKNFNFFNNIFVVSDTSDMYFGFDSSLNDVFLGNVWMRKNGGFAQYGFTDFEKWSKATGYEQFEGELLGSTFQKKVFSIPSQINITDPYSLQTNALLLSLCSRSLANTGIDVRKILPIDIGKTDFFGHAINTSQNLPAGICLIK